MKVYPIRKASDIKKIELLLQAKSRRNYLLWLIGANTGFRVSDILTMKVADVKGSYIELVEKKTNKVRKVSINSKLKKAIKSYIIGMKDTDVLFPSRKGVNKAITPRQCQRIIKSVANLVGVSENVSSHTMRKTFALNLYNISNKNIGLVMEALNHSSQSVTLRYLCLADEMLDNMIELLASC